MPIADDVFVSTTSTVQDAKITAYHDVIASHVVAGTGLFSDVAASWSDVFGGRSKSYQKQLSQINEEVIRQLKEKAVSMGANGIIGLRVDHDQVSSQGKAMFMVTATGTAVDINLAGVSSEQPTSGKSGTLTGEQVSAELEKLEILDKLQEDDYSIGKDDMDFLRERRVVEAAPYLIDYLVDALEYRKTKLEEMAKDYFMSVPTDVVRDNLYPALFSKTQNLFRFAFNIIEEREVFDAVQIKRLLTEGSFKQKKAALKLIRAEKSHYTHGDISELKEMRETVKSSFDEVVETLEVSGTFSSKTTTKWKCICEKKNKMNDERCTKCGRDRRGFYPDDWAPEAAVELLDRKVDVLKNRFIEQ
jgi:uncharacterized protein YbjQ (UPF0145 family)